MRGIDLLASLELDVADGQHVAGAFVEQPDDALIQLVNDPAMSGNGHAQEDCKIQ
jgi:hypothetical protein